MCCHYTMGERRNSIGKHHQVFIMPYHANPACREVMPQFQQCLVQARGPPDMAAGFDQLSGEQEALPVMLGIRV